MDGDPRLDAGLRTPLPAALEQGAASALFIHGWALTGGRAVRELEITAGGEATPALAAGMPSPGLAAELGLAAGEAGDCFFWGVVALPALEAGAELELGLRARLRGGGTAEASLGSIAVAPRREPPALAAPASVAICMATHEPPPALLERQLESLRAQTHGDWVCLISDDATGPGRLAELERLIAGDERFVLSRSPERLGAYANFGRALGMVPAEVPFVALCDQDDSWHPGKLATLLEAIGPAALAFSDMRIVDEAGAELSPTYWTHRVPNHESFASLLLGNTVTGAASLFRRELLDEVLPLPPRAGNLFHDHWLALVAAASGEIAYVPRALYDYVQHTEAVVGHAGANRGVVGGSFARRLLALRDRPRGDLRESWRRIYFGEYIRMRLTARALDARLGDRIAPAPRRALRLVDRGSWAAPWLAVRQLRRLRRDDTQGSEAAMLRALAWRAAIGRGRRGEDADLPAPAEAAQSASATATAR